MDILRRGHPGELFALDLQPFANRRIQTTGYRREDARGSKRGMSRNAIRKFKGRAHQIVMGHDPVDEAERESMVRCERIAGEQKL